MKAKDLVEQAFDDELTKEEVNQLRTWWNARLGPKLEAPLLSTGYEPDLAKKTAMTPWDKIPANVQAGIRAYWATRLFSGH